MVVDTWCSQCGNSHSTAGTEFGTTGGSSPSGAPPTVWFLDRGLEWHYLCPTFTAYLRLALVHLGIPQWQYAFTPWGPPPRVKVLKEDKKQESSKMETNEIRAVIKCLCKKGMLSKEIYEDMVDTLRDDAISYSTVKKWVATFKLGRISTEDEHRPGRPVESVTQENIDKIHDLVMLDRRMTVCQIEETLGIPKQMVDRIMREHLGLRNLSSRWVHKLFTPDQKAGKRKLSSDNLALFEANPEKFVNRFVTMDETWAHHFTTESKQQSMQ
ncbi:hypothetical protein LAZ67_2005893 [Cordylochernes scorpioides]|uniref:Mos1 transposase HTH domain-containing protein n=1 Tax=Cordylochernes scorpioides TaxID=51811 RepID=A0ABY6K503_9ARAC|nr:hypothetical protein LAZ67_2005893 [Cordylochernes scorpioides]